MRSFILCLLMVSGLSRAAADDALVIDRFLDHCRRDTTLDEASRQRVTAAVEQARKDPASTVDAITAGLKEMSSDFAGALQALGGERSEEAVRLLEPLAASTNPFLASEATLLLARARIIEERLEDAVPLLTRVIDQPGDDTLRRGEALFLRAQSEAAALDRDAAVADLERFLAEYPEAPKRMRGEARALRIDIAEAEANLLLDIHERMDFSGRRLALADSGARTQDTQDEVVSLLTELIDELEKKCGQCRGCKSACNKPGGGGMGGASPGQSAGTSQAAVLSERTGPRSAWVDLRQRQDDPTAFNASKSAVPLQYRGLVEQYYKSFQKSADQ